MQESVNWQSQAHCRQLSKLSIYSNIVIFSFEKRFKIGRRQQTQGIVYVAHALHSAFAGDPICLISAANQNQQHHSRSKP